MFAPQLTNMQVVKILDNVGIITKEEFAEYNNYSFIGLGLCRYINRHVHSKYLEPIFKK